VGHVVLCSRAHAGRSIAEPLTGDVLHGLNDPGAADRERAGPGSFADPVHGNRHDGSGPPPQRPVLRDCSLSGLTHRANPTILTFCTPPADIGRGLPRPVMGRCKTSPFGENRTRCSPHRIVGQHLRKWAAARTAAESGPAQRPNIHDNYARDRARSDLQRRNLQSAMRASSIGHRERVARTEPWGGVSVCPATVARVYAITGLKLVPTFRRCGPAIAVCVLWFAGVPITHETGVRGACLGAPAAYAYALFLASSKPEPSARSPAEQHTEAAGRFSDKPTVAREGFGFARGRAMVNRTRVRLKRPGAVTLRRAGDRLCAFGEHLRNRGSNLTGEVGGGGGREGEEGGGNARTVLRFHALPAATRDRAGQSRAASRQPGIRSVSLSQRCA